MKHIKNKKMITYPVDGLLLVDVVGLGVEVGVADVVVCVFVDQRYGRTHFDKGYIRHDNMHVQPCYGHGNHSRKVVFLCYNAINRSIHLYRLGREEPTIEAVTVSSRLE